MSSGEHYPCGCPTVRQGSLQCCRGSEGNADSRNDLSFQARRTQSLEFLASSSEQQGIARLETHYRPDRASVSHNQRVDFVLRNASVAAALSDRDDQSCPGNQRNYLLADQIVVQHNVSFAQNVQSLEREELWIARACSHQIDFACRSAAHAPTLLLGGYTRSRSSCTRFAPGACSRKMRRRSSPMSFTAASRSSGSN